MNETSEKKPLLTRAKGAVLHRIRQWAKDLLLFRILPGEYRRAAKQPIQPGKVVFLENKEPTVPESFEVLYERLSCAPRRRRRSAARQRVPRDALRQRPRRAQATHP